MGQLSRAIQCCFIDFSLENKFLDIFDSICFCLHSDISKQFIALYIIASVYGDVVNIYHWENG